MTLSISHIVAAAANGVIGANGKIPWHIPEDFKFFKQTTMGHPIIMGRKTFDSIGKPLPGRPNIVVTRQKDLKIEGVHVCTSVEAALELCTVRQKEWGEEVFIIGGGEIYRRTLSLTKQIFLTKVLMSVSGDALYPKIPISEFESEQLESFEEPVPYERWLFQRRS